MSYKCEICSKKTRIGRQHTHHAGVAGGQWKKRAQTTTRTFKPNLHTITMKINGIPTKVRACTKCIKKAKIKSKSTESKN